MEQKELTIQEREEMQNKAINAASLLITSEENGQEYQNELNDAVMHVENAIYLALDNVSAYDVVQAKDGIKERMFIAGVLRQISERIRLLCVAQ